MKSADFKFFFLSLIKCFGNVSVFSDSDQYNRVDPVAVCDCLSSSVTL